MLEALGLTSAAGAVYLALLQFPESSLADLAVRLGVTEDQARDALDELARLSLLRRFGSAQGWRPVDPELGLAALLARQQAEVARRQQAVEESKAAVAALLAQYFESRPRLPQPDVEHLEGLEHIRERLAELAVACQWEACSFMPGGAQSLASMEASRALDAEAVERGVRLRTIYLDSVRNDRPTLEYAQWLVDIGSEVRTAPSLPLRILIVDREKAVVPIDSEQSGAMAVVVSGGGLLTALLALFQSVWKAATPLGAAHRRDDHGLTPQQRQVLKLLGAGLTDEMIARRLGVSVRTTRRVASDLLARLGARGRFQAGARAVLRGWIDVDDLD